MKWEEMEAAGTTEDGRLTPLDSSIKKTFLGPRPLSFDMKIKKLKKGDTKKVSSLLEDIFKGMSNIFPPHAIFSFIQENSEDEITRLMERNNRLYLVAEKDNEIIGVVHGYYYGDIFYITWIGVQEECRGSGVGSALLNGLEKRVCKRCHKIQMISAVDLGALRFYRRNGYECEGLLRKAWWGVDHYCLGKVL